MPYQHNISLQFTPMPLPNIGCIPPEGRISMGPHSPIGISRHINMIWTDDGMYWISNAVVATISDIIKLNSKSQ